MPFSRKRRRRDFSETNGEFVSWRDLPAFCDASTSVACTTFASRRLPEIKSLWRAIVDEEGDEDNEASGNNQKKKQLVEAALKSGGCKTSSRHLRRRATSHNSRKRHRYPTGAEKTKINADDNEPHRSDKGPSRRARRRKRSLLRCQHEQWRYSLPSMEFADDEDNSKGPRQGTTVAHNWMPTHLWHAKRFRIETLWGGWRVPMLHNNRGAQAALRLVARENKTLLQDATWCHQPLCVRIAALRNGDQEQLRLKVTLLGQALRRVVPNFAIHLDEEKTSVAVATTGEGVFYETDNFPSGAIGPVRWLFDPGMFRRRSLQHEEESSSPAKSYLVHIWTHPSTRSVIFCILDSLIQSLRQDHESGIIREFASTITLHDGYPGGMMYVKLRGRTVVECLSAAFQDHWKGHTLFKGLTDDNIFEIMPHGTCVSLPMPPRSEKATCLTETSSDERKGRLLLLSQCPRDHRLPCNYGVCGLDLIMMCGGATSSNVASSHFVDLVVKGGACPVGLVEEMHANLEASPPIPVFPRDFPETSEGIRYWNGQSYHRKGRSIGGGDGDALSNDLASAILRHYFEGGVARISGNLLSSSKPRRVNWSLFVETDTARPRPNTVVVRGSFGDPFLEALEYGAPSLAGPSRKHDSTHLLDRSPRRKRRCASSCFVIAPPLSKSDSARHESLCTALLHSLSLPALILCHVTIAGKGTARPGTYIFAFTDVASRGLQQQGSEDGRDYTSSMPLGCITSGVFSPSRGSCQGIAVCGAARFLRAVASSRRHKCLVIRKGLQVVDSHGATKNRARRVSLRVRVGGSGDGTTSSVREGTIRLLP